MSASTSRRTTTWIALGLVLAVLATYAEVFDFGFVRYDDPDYVLENPSVRAGLGWAGLRWAFSSAHASNWHPLSWLAHMLDVQLFGLAPAGHHASSVLLHALGAVLCFHALRALTRSTVCAALTAFLFALHPLRVESVAWISERKDVLSGVFFFATLWAYTAYARAPSVARYALVLLGFGLGLLAKPMLVSVPGVLLLLDVWPLARIAPGTWRRRLPRLVLEKLPLVLLALGSCLVTVHAQRAGGSLSTLELLPLSARLANAPLSVLRYLGHFLWPSGLAYFYPHRALVDAHAPAWNAAAWGALVAVLALSAAALAAARRRPALGVGWFWFLGMLVPVLGIVQVGEQALADRYAYLPLVGIQLALVDSLLEFAARRARWRVPLGATAVLLLATCGVLSARQARVWRDSTSLFAHALRVTERNYAAHVGLANEEADAGALEAARADYESALAIRPDYAPALYGLGLLEQEHGDPERALELYRAALVALPGLAAAELNLGSLLGRRGERVAAAQAFEHVLELYPEHPEAHYDLALLLLQAGQLEDALPHLEAALRARPDYGAAWEKLGLVQQELGLRDAAIEALEHALQDPSAAEAPRALAWLLATAPEAEFRDGPRALELARRAVQASARRDPRALEALAAAFAATGEFSRAVEVQEEALRLFAPGQQGAARARLERYRRGEPALPTE